MSPRVPKELNSTGTWPQYGSDASHDGVTTNTGVKQDGEPYWQLRRIRSGPAVIQDGRLFHFAKLGNDPSGVPTVTRTRASPAGTAHPVYGEPALIAREASTGRIQWSQPLDGPPFRWPAVADGQVIAGVNGQLAAFAAADGQRLWEHDLGDRILADPTIVSGTVVIPVQGVVDGQTGELIEEPQIRTYDLADGSPGWTANPPKRGNAIAVGDETVVVVSGGWDGTGVVLGLALDDGSERWRITTAGDFFRGPTIADGTVYFASSEAYVSALDLHDGTEQWQRVFPSRPTGIAADVETAYIGVGERLHAAATNDGSDRWSISRGDGSFGFITPAIGEDTVYAGTAGVRAWLYALDADDGEFRWSHQFPDKVIEGDIVRSGIEAQPAIVDGAVYAYAVDGLYAFGESS